MNDNQFTYQSQSLMAIEYTQALKRDLSAMTAQRNAALTKLHDSQSHITRLVAENQRLERELAAAGEIVRDLRTANGFLERITAPSITFPAKSSVSIKCPVCDGTGLVSKPNHIAGDQESWTAHTTGPYPCKVCDGSGVLPTVAPDGVEVRNGKL